MAEATQSVMSWYEGAAPFVIDTTTAYYYFLYPRYVINMCD